MFFTIIKSKLSLTIVILNEMVKVILKYMEPTWIETFLFLKTFFFCDSETFFLYPLHLPPPPLSLSLSLNSILFILLY